MSLNNSTCEPSFHVNKYRNILFSQRSSRGSSFVQGFLNQSAATDGHSYVLFPIFSFYNNTVIKHCCVYIYIYIIYTSSVMTIILICCSQSRIYSYLCDPKSHRQSLQRLKKIETLPARIKETINIG